MPLNTSALRYDAPYDSEKYCHLTITQFPQAPEPTFKKAAGQASTLANEIDMVEWAKDKRPIWEAVVQKYGGKTEAFDWGTWGFFNWATGKSWCTVSSITKARKYGWHRADNTFETWVETFRSYENAGLLPPRAGLLRGVS